MWTSVPQMPVRRISIKTSLMPTSGVGTSSSQRPGSDFFLTNAFMAFLGVVYLFSQGRRKLRPQLIDRLAGVQRPQFRHVLAIAQRGIELHDGFVVVMVRDPLEEGCGGLVAVGVRGGTSAIRSARLGAMLDRLILKPA